MMTTRRFFLRNSALAMVGSGAAPLWLERALYAGAPSPRKKVLVAIFQRGAADGLNIVVPHAEKRYYEMRPTIAVPRPSQASARGADAAIDLDGFFGLHPALAPLKPTWDDGHLAIVHAAGSPDPTRSHFDAQDFMEAGTPGMKATADGWMNRALPHTEPAAHISPVRAVAMGPVLPRAMRGVNPAVAVQNLNDFQVRNREASGAFQSLYADSQDPLLHAAGRETFEAVSLVQSIQKQHYEPAAGANYPKGRFGDCLRQIAQLIKADVGVEMAFADVGGWDHHVNEVGARASEGQLAARLADFGQALAAFWLDLGDRRHDTAVVTMSEFGRTARENGDRGTDHGHGSVYWVMGGGINGGRILGEQIKVEQATLFQNRDYPVLTDYRALFAGLFQRMFGLDNAALGRIFAGVHPAELGLV
jgi:uncharacterized protein (DUF1501 family)